MILEPHHGRYDSPRTRRAYDGSSVEIGPDRVRWVPPTHRPDEHPAFDLPVGDRPGEAHAVVRVHAAFPTRYDDGLVTTYVVTDTGGTPLGSFPSGEGSTGSALPQHPPGWYPAPVVRDAAERAGLAWDDQDLVGRTGELAATFPGSVPHLRLWQVMAWVQGIAYLAMSLVCLVVALLWVALGEGSDRVVLPLAFGFFAVATAGLALMFFPPWVRSARRRQLARAERPAGRPGAEEPTRR
ncbi:hypothetical protein [Cellulomonas chitinilytica]|uniref:hypothetical protein n=1 Tax=Cellulomonas chitinilytica TaxID=398759 RepID=UPI001941654B|nr:hypothetical protein [Cellulomonas chitinilytica]